MGWGIDLWDRRGNIEAATAESIEFVGTCRHMLGAVAKVEAAYAEQMRKALKPFMGVMANDNSSEAQVFKQLLATFDHMATSKEMLSDRLGAGMQGPLDSLVADKRKTRSGFLQQLASLDQIESKELAKLGKARKKYEKIEKDADHAEAEYMRAQKSDNVTLGKVEKLRETWEKKSRVRDGEETQLKAVNDEVNAFRTRHYHVDLPAVIDQLEESHLDRGTKLVELISKVGSQCNECESSIQNALKQLEDRAANHNPKADSATFVNVYKSGAGPPQDLPLHPPGSARGARIQQQAAPTQQQQQPAGQQMDDGGDDDEPLPEMAQQILILYDFPGTNEGELPCSANEWLSLVSNDGSGWILASKSDGTQGYVPSTYIDGMG